MTRSFISRICATILLGALAGGMTACSQPNEAEQINNLAVAKEMPTLYLRGTFNRWDTSLPLAKTSAGKYTVTANLSSGVHGFKLASKDSAFQILVSKGMQNIIDLQANLEQPLTTIKTKKTDKHSKLIAEKAGQYIFALDVNSAAAKLTISKAEDIQSNTYASKGEQFLLNFSDYGGGSHTATFSIEDVNQGLRTYVHSTTQPLRDPVPQHSVYQEDSNLPRLRSGDIAFDALFALAISEMKLDSVSHIRDKNYNNHNAIGCDCFETGEKWNYVWTRDLSYAADLSLGLLDPERVKNSLEFKLSGYREGVDKPVNAAGSQDGLQIIQDTGSGGSWPISTDRITWAFGAESVLNNLTGEEREAFAKKALLALSNTIENDRLVAFDVETGLYMGEQSFLDWREQTYTHRISDDLSSMATAKAISTNAGHYQAIRLAQRLAEEFAVTKRSQRYRSWGDALKKAINQHLWITDAGLYSSLTAGHFDNQPMLKFDWLGQSLAIITGIASEEQARQILANYPHGPMGAPVIFPQQPDIRVYHNRAIWPFVTAYGLKAAKAGHNIAVADSAYDTLIRSAALNLSNMENMEWLSGQPIWLERDNLALSGPVVNSKRQLWSVAAYLNMVIEGVFGVHPTRNGLQISPYITTALRQKYFANENSIALENLTWKGKKMAVEVEFPQADQAQGVYSVSQISLNGRAIEASTIAAADLKAHNKIVIRFGKTVAGDTLITKVHSMPGGYDENVFAPFEPKLSLSVDGQAVTLNILDERNTGDVTYQIFRNGELTAEKEKKGQWQDPQPIKHQACYAVAAIYQSSATQSHHSEVVCTDSGELITVDDNRVVSNKVTENIGGQAVIRAWGAQQDSLEISQIQINHAGKYAIQFSYTNLLHNIGTGITCGVKWITIKDANGNVVKNGVVQLPHTKEKNGSAYSTPLEVELSEGEYQLSLSDFYNMSYFTNNQTYNAAGGKNGAINHFDLYALRVLPIVR